jgi:hypothetical protein
MGDYPPGVPYFFTRIWPYEELCRFSALVDNPWKWCASCWRKIAISNNVGSVKHFRAHCGLHSEKSAISL